MSTLTLGPVILVGGVRHTVALQQTTVAYGLVLVSSVEGLLYLDHLVVSTVQGNKGKPSTSVALAHHLRG